MTTEIEAKRKELEEDVMTASGDNTEVCSIRDLNDHILEGFNLGVEMARKEFTKDMVFLLSKYFQSIGNKNFVQMKGDYSYNLFCYECYEYLKSLEEKK